MVWTFSSPLFFSSLFNPIPVWLFVLWGGGFLPLPLPSGMSGDNTHGFMSFWMEKDLGSWDLYESAKGTSWFTFLSSSLIWESSKTIYGGLGNQLNKHGQELVILNMTLFKNGKAHYNMKWSSIFFNVQY